jgi:putative endonuclease
MSTVVMAYYVYILASRRDGAIYIGVTNDILRRIYEPAKGRTGLCVQVQHHTPALVRDLRGCLQRDFQGETAEEVEAELEGQLMEAKIPKWNDLYGSICN